MLLEAGAPQINMLPELLLRRISYSWAVPWCLLSSERL